MLLLDQYMSNDGADELKYLDGKLVILVINGYSFSEPP